MPIPPYDANGVLPPHLGNPTNSLEVSPYRTDVLEICVHFATTPERIAILQGFLRLRAAFASGGMSQGFQLLDGSFLEDVETTEGRPPRDLDVVTMFWQFPIAQQQALVHSIPDLNDRNQLKANYGVDHYFFDAGVHPQLTVELSQYW